MNEDERGITPANVTAMTAECRVDGWRITIEQGNGDAVKTIELTRMEAAQLGMLLDAWPPLVTGPRHVEFVDFSR